MTGRKLVTVSHFTVSLVERTPMSRLRIPILVLISALVSAIVVQARIRPITLDEAIEIALKQNKSIVAAQLTVDKSQAQVTEAYGSALPSLNVSAGFNHNILLPVFFFPNPATGVVAPLKFGLTNTYSVSAQVQQILFNGAVMAGIQASKVYTDAAEAQLDAVTAEVVTETRKKFYQAAAASAFYGVAQSTLSNVRQTQNTIGALFAEGLVAEFDKIRADVAFANVQPLVIEASSAKYAAQAALQTYLAMDMSDTLEIDIANLPKIADVPNADEAVANAIATNFDLKALSFQLEITNKLIDVQRSDYYPTVAAFGQWQQQGQSNTLNDFRDATSSVVGLSFSMNLFNGMRTQARVEQSRIDVENVALRKSQITDLIKLQTRTLVNQLSSAKAKIAAQASVVDQAQRGYDIAQVRYKEGTGSLLEISDAETSLSRARVNEITSRMDYHSTRADFERVTGQIDEKYRRMVRK